ncbi:major tail protein [Cytobacillus sp. FSL R5-0569]|uniref:major tail protein n=1 Tax=Cytobacillus sp. FSL R5-0569 TaxID=2921649 RepID=UPI0030FA8ABC
MEKMYKASTGIDEFYYAKLDETGVSIIEGVITRLPGLQNIDIEMPQEIVRAYGDNKTMEMATSAGNITVSSTFHKIPAEDRRVLFGLETQSNGLYAYGSNDTPPYVACVFAKTHSNGAKEWVGLPKGIFLRPNIGGQTKGGGVEFTSDEITAEFMDRHIVGFDEEKSVIFGLDVKGETEKRDALFQAIFGVAYPTAITTPEGA